MLNKPKTFFNCYFYSLSNEKGNLVENNILEYITNAQRINYGDISFKAIKDQLKSRSTSAVLYRILQRGDINLCIYKKELPSSFKVFCAKDKRAVGTGSNNKKIFIDATGLIEFQDGQFYCKDIDRLATYLTGALVQMIYYNDTVKLTNNAILQKCSTSAFVKMFSGVMDYLKVNNYLQNRDRILYIAGVYFAYSVIGMDINSARKISAVVNNVPAMDQQGHDYRYIEDDLKNINTFFESLIKTFKLTGLSTSVFTNKWLYLYGKGTIYALELYPIFLSTMMYAYAGTYINNWKKIEATCGKDMVDIATNVFKIGGDIYNRGFSYESSTNIPEYNNSCCNPPKGFKKKSIDDKDYKNESYSMENELSGLLEMEENEDVVEGGPKDKAANDRIEQQQRQKQEQEMRRAQQQQQRQQQQQMNQNQNKINNESVEDTVERIYKIKNDGEFNGFNLAKSAFSYSKDDNVATPEEGEFFVDALEDDDPMQESVDSPNEISADAFDNHDSVGEPRDSEEVKNLVNAVEDDDDFNI